ncbi:uncharacterized protein CLUP02_00203 [Colletotrichum lupini]|uniref:Uncharacterized protein n=1 Tax=Colletotrichum lupini TaxID=145971 RepID=A0A9Q8SAK9_9PEZI|nr:uncharacterized protein CLUP02_00203 [Colletotrichum lupini]UQC73558.1 hypothetical protein CLUP02_00203 [Colletotrichum lupini]
MVGWVKRARPSRGCNDEAANYVAMPPWSISNQCLSRTEQLAGLVRDEFFHGLNAGEDAQHERLRRHGKAQVAERQEEDCRTAGEEEEEDRRRPRFRSLLLHKPLLLPVSGHFGQDPSDGGRLLETAKLPSPVDPVFVSPSIAHVCASLLKASTPLSLLSEILPHSRVTRFNAYLLRLDHATHIPPSSFTKHFHGLKTHGGRSNADILPQPENRHRLTSSACSTTVLTTPYFTPIPRVCQFPLRSTSRLGFCSLSSRRHESSPSLDPPSNARSLDHASLTIARSELLRRTFSPFLLPWDPHSVLPLVQQPNLLPLLLRLRPVSSIDLSLLVITKRNTVDYFAGE